MTQEGGRRGDPRPVAVALLAHLRRARDHIDRHYREPLDLDQLAAVAGVSKYHFVRSFEATYGETPIRYLTRRRIERAQDLLRVGQPHGDRGLHGWSGSPASARSPPGSPSWSARRPTAYRDRWAARGGPHVPGCYLFMRGVLDLAGTTGGPIRNLGEARGRRRP